MFLNQLFGCWKLEIKSLSLMLVGLTVVVSQPSSATGQDFTQAVNLYKSGNYGQALDEFRRASATQPSNALIHYYMALCEQSLNQVTEAKKEYDWVAEHDNGLKSQALTGSAQMLRLMSRRTSSTTSSTDKSEKADAKGSKGDKGDKDKKDKDKKEVAAAPSKKVKKVLVFYQSLNRVWAAFEPALDEAKSKYKDVDFQRVDVDQDSSQAAIQKYNVSQFPYIIYLDGSGAVMDQGSNMPLGDSLGQTIDQLNKKQ